MKNIKKLILSSCFISSIFTMDNSIDNLNNKSPHFEKKEEFEANKKVLKNVKIKPEKEMSLEARSKYNLEMFKTLEIKKTTKNSFIKYRNHIRLRKFQRNAN